MGLRTNFNAMGALPKKPVGLGLPFPTGTAFVADIPNDEFLFTWPNQIIIRPKRLGTSQSVQCDWGDGSVNTYTYARPQLKHTYHKSGKYVINISDDLSIPPLFYVNETRSDYLDSILSIRALLRIGDSVTSLFIASSTTLKGAILAGCVNATGAIPKWGDAIEDARYAFYNCTSLAGIWDETAPDDEIMPPRITKKTNCVTGASDAVRKHFTSAWGGTKAI